MKYSLYINQPKAVELGLNVSQALMFDLITGVHVWAQDIIVDGEVYYWVARSKICEELPILNLKPDTAYRHLKALREIGLIEHIKKGKKDLIRVTDLGRSYYSEKECSTYVGKKSEFCETSSSDTMSEKNPSYYVGKKSENDEKVGKKSELLCRKKIRVTMSEKNPTYKLTKDKLSNDQRGGRSLTPIPEDFEPCETTLIHLERNGLKPLDKDELQDFIDYYLGEGKMKANWNRVYQRWVSNQRRNYDKRKKGYFKKPEAPVNTGPQSNTGNDHLTRKRVPEEDKQSQEKLKGMLDAIEQRKNIDKGAA